MSFLNILSTNNVSNNKSYKGSWLYDDRGLIHNIHKLLCTYKATPKYL